MHEFLVLIQQVSTHRYIQKFKSNFLRWLLSPLKLNETEIEKQREEEEERGRKRTAVEPVADGLTAETKNFVSGKEGKKKKAVAVKEEGFCFCFVFSCKNIPSCLHFPPYS